MLEKKVGVQRFYDWHKSQRFENSEEFHKVANEFEFLQKVIYPMFYKPFESSHSTFFFQDVPYIIGNHDGRYPIYWIENQYFQIVFIVNHDSLQYECDSWEISFITKDCYFCGEKIIKFKDWYFAHYKALWDGDDTPYLEEMPKAYRYSGLKRITSKDKRKWQRNFSITFPVSDLGNALFFEFMNTFRLY